MSTKIESIALVKVSRASNCRKKLLINITNLLSDRMRFNDSGLSVMLLRYLEYNLCDKMLYVSGWSLPAR